MSKDDLQTKIEFVEKMKHENPRAFEFLGRGATNLLLSLERDLQVDLSELVNRAIKIIGLEKMKTMLQLKIAELG